MNRLGTIVAILLMTLAAARPGIGAEPVMVRGGVHDDYVRLVFDWPKPVTYKARIEVGRLVINFPESRSFDFSKAKGILRKYIQFPRDTGDGRRLSFPLLRDFELRHFADGPRVVVDLIKAKPAAATGKPTPVTNTQSLAAGSGSGPSVRVRVGQHSGYGRLVFDWPKAVSYRVTIGGGKAVVRFEGRADLDLRDFRKRPPRQIRDLAVTSEGGGLTVTLSVSDDAEVRHFTDGPKVAIDVLGPGARKSDSASAKPAGGKAASKSPVARSRAPAPTGQAAVVARQAAGSASPNPAPTGNAPSKGSEVYALAGRVAQVTKVAPAERKLRPLPGPQAPARVELSLRLPWSQGAEIAVFRRGKHIWLVFARRAPKGMETRISPEFGPIQRIDTPAGTALYFEAPVGYFPSARRVDGDWVVDLRPREAEPLKALEGRFSDDLQSLLIPIDRPGPVIRITDPEVGDKLYIVPVASPGLGSGIERSFPAFRILRAFQGLVVLAASDALRLAKGPADVVLTARDALAASNKPFTLVAETPLLPGRRLLDLQAWRGEAGEDPLKRKQTLQAALLTENEEQQALARLALARFYFAEGFASETLSQLDTLVAMAPDFAADPQVMLIRAASQFLIDDFEEAARNLNRPALAAEGEAGLWRAALAARAADWEAAAPGFAATRPLIDAYPRAVRVRLRLLSAEAALEAGDQVAAEQELTALRTDSPGRAERSRITFLYGLRAHLAGDDDTARQLWMRVADGADRPSRARAQLALVDLALKQGTMTPAEAIEQLERLRFALMERLADLYLAEGDFRSALGTLRQAASYLPTFRRSGVVGQKMRDVFTDLYLKGAADALPPLTALSLYDEFRELTPVGAQGDEMIARLAERLAEVDLLAEAGDLLEGQVRSRLSGVDGARIGARLAVIRLLDRQAAKALEALDQSRAKGLPAPLARERRHLRARALAGLARDGEALRLLSGDRSATGIRLRSEILSRRGDWASAAAALAQLLPPPPNPGADFSKEAGRAVTNVAVALALAGDRRGLKSLDRRFGAAMAATPDGATFALLAQDRPPGDAPSIAEVLARAERAEAFLAAYRRRVSGGQLSELN